MAPVHEDVLESQFRRPPSRHRATAIVAVVAVLVGTAGGFLLRLSVEGPKPPRNPASATTADGKTGSVTVSVTNVTGARGMKLGVLLYRGVPHVVGDEGAPYELLGGFGVPVISDPFSVVQTVGQGTRPLRFIEAWQAPGPELDVPVGTHTLWITLARVISASQTALERGCQVHVEVLAGRMTIVRINGVPPPVQGADGQCHVTS